ncbi:hypothetical protein [Sphingomonas oligoaromativorans]|uniref:competence protein CoiA family protein n=1 Tax=Sphingomonas oligoaromativorans TaxID=575322 RepID=UPI001ABA0DC2|nr:hypothetical protein [Sphingomonas oligoaromativorans]NIJ35313.1 hypothetical protein [Sphingomonas oligoaromativorans]
MPAENVKHWRHKAGDCDRWGEPEGPWHLGWKEQFDIGCREIGLYDNAAGEWHRADVLVNASTPKATVLELQHSSISEQERMEREAFYRQNHRMFWLVHLHDESSFTGTSFALSLGLGNRIGVVNGHTFQIVHFASRSSQFIEKWKRSAAHVFFDFGGHIFFLAGEAVARQVNGGLPLKKGDFAYCQLTRDQFIRAVHGAD